MKFFTLFALLILGLLSTTDAFQTSSGKPKRRLKGESSASALGMTVLAYKGKKRDFRAGSKLKQACSALGVKPKYSCTKGDCGSCTLSVGGQRMKPCVAKVPPEPRLKSLKEKGLEIR